MTWQNWLYLARPQLALSMFIFVCYGIACLSATLQKKPQPSILWPIIPLGIIWWLKVYW